MLHAYVCAYVYCTVHSYQSWRRYVRHRTVLAKNCYRCGRTLSLWRNNERRRISPVCRCPQTTMLEAKIRKQYPVNESTSIVPWSKRHMRALTLLNSLLLMLIGGSRGFQVASRNSGSKLVQMRSTTPQNSVSATSGEIQAVNGIQDLIGQYDTFLLDMW